MLQYYPSQEEPLLSRVREDDGRAFNRIYEQYWHKLYRAAYGRLRDREVAQELVQEVFANLWLRRADLCIEKSLDNATCTVPSSTRS